MELAAKKIKRQVVFSRAGAAELEAFQQEVCDNLKLAFGVFMSGDVKLARQLITEKASLRATEFAAAERHLLRLRDGRAESLESSSLHLDILRDLKRIHSHICSVACPVLERAGALQPSRLREMGEGAGSAAKLTRIPRAAGRAAGASAASTPPRVCTYMLRSRRAAPFSAAARSNRELPARNRKPCAESAWASPSAAANVR
jgi:hypothetical protein